MNILIFNWQDIKNPFGGGAEVHLHEIFKRIVKMGHNVTLICCKSDGLADEEIIDGIRILRYGNRNLFNYAVPHLYRNFIQNNKVDIVVDDINKIPFYTPRFVKHPILAISHHFFGKSILIEAGLLKGLYVLLGEKLVNKYYKSTPFAVVSQSTLDEFIHRGFSKENFRIITNAIDHTQFPFQHNEKTTDEFRIAYFGRLKKYKRVEHLFYAFQKFSKEYQNSLLEIIGTGDYEPYLKKLALKLGIEDKIKFYGYVPEDEKKRLLMDVDVVVNTSQKEGWGITNIEANACGTPVISANVPGLRDSVKNYQSGLLYEFGNIDDLKNKLIQLLTDPQLNAQLQKGAIEWARSFNWEISAHQMLQYCQDVIDNFKK